eukprot:CAMPEP_0114638292 /NCGR_PEP_ID=MMETSP0191-20121206/543_1 /TAXON_ID=126664 /ORGANISM="Sorites sp." /LENGTH=38 /DNA_ID= /DNA_START= /DNA_END= /DNA_ORIENTATION=
MPLAHAISGDVPGGKQITGVQPAAAKVAWPMATTLCMD